MEEKKRYSGIYNKYYKNSGKWKKYKKEWEVKNKDKRKEYNQRYYLKTRKLKGICKGDKHPRWSGGLSKKEANRRWLKNNPDKAKLYRQKWAKENPEKNSFHTKRYQAKKRGAKGNHTLEEWKELKKKFNYICQMCGLKEPEIKLEEDHIIPLSKGGSDYIENIQPLCRSCNSKKSSN